MFVSLILTITICMLVYVQGYGDISPKTPFARIVVILIIAISFILIPLEVARLADAYASIPKYRVGYKMTGKALHIILVTSSAGSHIHS